MKITELIDKNEYAKSLYGTWLAQARTLDELWKGEWTVPQQISDMTPALKIIKPSTPHTLVNKYMQMLAIRSQKSYQVGAHNDSQTERDKTDFLERALRAYYDTLRSIVQSDKLRDGTWYAVVRGRGCFQVAYEPNRKKLPLRIKTPDPMETFPVRGEDGIEWFTKERWMTRRRMKSYFDGLPEKTRRKMNIPILDWDPKANYGNGGPADMLELIQVIEYWDDEKTVWAVNEELVQEYEHKYGFMPLTEVRFGGTPLEDERWSNMALLGAIIEDIKGETALDSMLASGASMFYWPLIIAQSETGAAVIIDPYARGSLQSIPPDAKITVIQPQVNDKLIELMASKRHGNINKATLPEVAFVSDLPAGMSGFAVSQHLSLVQDAIADSRDAIEWGFGETSGNVLRGIEIFGPRQKDKGFVLPVSIPGSNRRERRVVTKEDVDGHHDVRVSVKVALPQDKLQMATLFNQLFQIDPITGAPRIDFETAIQLSGLGDVIEDLGAAKRRIEFQMALNTIPELKQKYFQKILASVSDETMEWQKEVEREGRKQARREARRAEREIDKGLSQDAVVPGEQFNDLNFWQQGLTLLQSGQDPRALLSQDYEAPPAAAPQNPSPEAQQVMQMLLGTGGEQPTGLAGYQGMNPEALPAPMQGAQPRMAVDRSNVAVEQIDRLNRRGGLPPAK